MDKECSCPMECNFVSYSINFFSTPFDPWEMCPRSLGADEFPMREFYENKSPPQFIRRLKQFKYNVTAEDEEICKKNIQYRAQVIFRIATDTLPVTVMSRRLSFYDQLSALGILDTYYITMT